MLTPITAERRAKSSGKRKLAPQDWVKAALEVLASQGIEGVRVDTLARKLGVTKGSFYWHFNSRDELLDALAASWGETEGESFMNEVLALKGDPRMKMSMLGAIYLRENYPAYERAMRGWALTDSRAVEALKKASARTMRTLVRLYGELGFEPSEAEFRARIHRLSGIGILFAPEFDMESMSEEERMAQRTQFLDLLTQPNRNCESSINSEPINSEQAGTTSPEGDITV